MAVWSAITGKDVCACRLCRPELEKARPCSVHGCSCGASAENRHRARLGANGTAIGGAGWAEEAAQYAESVVIIPKVSGVIDRLPRRIGKARIVLGYSVPTRYGGTNVPLWEFNGWPIHLLGGSPEMQFALYALFSGTPPPTWLPRKAARFYERNRMFMAPGADVVSMDGNMASKLATQRASFWRREPGVKGHWVNLREVGPGVEHDAPYAAFELSMQNIAAEWRRYVGRDE